MTYWLYFFDAAILLALGFAILQLSLIGRCVVATQEDVDKLTVQVQKVGLEVQNVKTALADVQAQLDAAGVPAEQVDLSGLVAAVQAVDDLNPDPVVPVEEVVPVVEDVVTDVVSEEPVVVDPVVTEDPVQ